MRKPLNLQEKFFIRNAAQIEEEPATKIAEQIKRSPYPVTKFIRSERLRSPEQTRQIFLTALKSRHFPANEKRQEVIQLLREAKKNPNLLLGDIATKTNISPTYVLRVNTEEEILSKQELSERKKERMKKTQSILFQKKHDMSAAEAYFKARQMIASTKKNFVQIAKELVVSPQFVGKANKGKDKDKQIRDTKEIERIAFGLKPINHFSFEEKIQLVEKTEGPIRDRLYKKKIPAKFHDEIVDQTKDLLLKRLDYFDPKRGVPLEAFLAY